MKVDNLARAIERDLLAERPKSAPTPECVACGWSYTPKAEGDDSTRFCSARCREAYDAGFPPHDPRYHTKGNQRWYALPLGREGFKIDCAGCGKRFDSLGLRCCSIECERGLARSGRPSASRSRPASSSCPSSAPSASARRARATSHAGATAGRCRARPDAPEVLGGHIPTPQPVWSLKQQRSARKMGLKMTVQTDHTPRSRALRRHRQATLRRNITRRLCRGVSLAWPQSRRSGTLTRHCDGPALPPHCLDHRRDSPYRHSVGDGRHHRLASRLPEEEARLRRLDQFPGALRRLLGDHVAAAALGSAIDALISRELAT
jgi:hypothetical protein